MNGKTEESKSRTEKRFKERQKSQKVGWKVGKRKRKFGKEDFQGGGQDGDVQDRKQDREKSEPTTHDSLMGTKMKSFWNRSTCRVHVFTRLCFLFWILPTENHRIKHPNGTRRQRRDL